MNFIRENKKVLIFLFLTWGVYFMILWPKMLYFNEAGDLVAGWRIIWADWAMHIGQTNNFFYNNILNVLGQHNLFDSLKLRYSFLTNLISGVLMRVGLDLVQSMIFPSIIFSFLLLLALFYFLKKLTKDNKEVILTINLFLLGGGMGFIYFIKDIFNNFNWVKFIFPPQEYTRIDDLNYYWYNTIIANFIPQRGFLLGMPIALFVVAKLFFYYKKDFKIKKIEKKLFFLGVITGLLTFVHTHSLLLIFLLCTILFLFDLKNWKRWIIYGLTTLVFALPFILGFEIYKGESFLRFYPGWLANKNSLNENVILFWLKNWGTIIPLALISFFSFKFKKKTKIFLTSFFVIFLICNLVLFQPYDWDNSKILLWVYLIFCFLISKLLIKIWRKDWVGKILASFLVLILTLSGGLDLIRILNTKKQSFVMITKQELNLANKLREISGWDDVILTSNNHLHWVSVMSGRRVFMGYNGWIWSWGIDGSTKEKQIVKMYQNSEEGRQLLKNNGISYVVTDNQTKKEYWSDDRYFEKEYEKILESGQYKVYKI